MSAALQMLGIVLGSTVGWWLWRLHQRHQQPHARPDLTNLLHTIMVTAVLFIAVISVIVVLLPVAD